MKDIATFIGESGGVMAVVYEADDKSYWKVNYGPVIAEATTFHKIFLSETDATNFAINYTDKGLKPTFLSEA